MMSVLLLLQNAALTAAELLALTLTMAPPAAAAAAAVPPAIERAAAAQKIAGPEAAEELSEIACGEPRTAGHARLTLDEALVDSVLLARNEAGDDRAACAPRNGSASASELSGADAARLFRVDTAAGPRLIVLARCAASHATLTLRPAVGDSIVRVLGPVQAGVPITVPLESHATVRSLNDAVIEIEFSDGESTVWTTVLAEPAAAATTWLSDSDLGE